MDFPSYVPAPVQSEISRLIDGRVLNPGDERSKEWVARMERERPDYLGEPPRGELPPDAIECLERLACDPRMREAYSLLTSEITKDHEWCDFIGAAVLARGDSAPSRERLRRAKKLRDEIVSTSERLARLLRNAAADIPFWPRAAYDMRSLLRESENRELTHEYRDRWRQQRDQILGDGDDPDHTIADAWSTAPSLAGLLDTVVTVAQGLGPRAGAAIVSRERNVKTEYLRAFAILLRELHGFTLTVDVKKTMAIVTTVVLSQPDVDVSYDDVRKVVSRLDEYITLPP
jgi:hypothetical protein|tara:strand:+ start:7566 stop:8429 length:864 start_codon:yes stop_codon:yes gene_type:complete